MEELQKRNGLYGFEFRDVDLRRAEEGERKTYNIKQMWQRMHEICRLHVLGYKNTIISEIMGVTPECVSMNINCDLGQRKIAELREARDEETKITTEKIQVLTNKALQTYNEIFDNEDGQATLKDRKDVADTILLELSGLRVPTKINTSSVHTTLTAAEIESFKNRGLKAAKEIGVDIIDVTPKEKNESEPKTT